MRSKFCKENIASIFRAKLGAMWFIKRSRIYSGWAGSMSLRNVCIHLSLHLMYLTRAQYNSQHYENLKSTCSWSAGFVLCRRTTDRWKYPLFFFQFVAHAVLKAARWKSDVPSGNSQLLWVNTLLSLSQRFYCYINVNLKILVLLSLRYIRPLFICIYKVFYVSLVKVGLSFSMHALKYESRS